MDAGFTRQTIFINTPFAPIKFYVNSDARVYSISPDMTDGMKFDTETGVISGIYTGSAKSVIYTVTAEYKEEVTSTTITIDYKGRCFVHFSISFEERSGKVNAQYQVCYYKPFANYVNFFPKFMYDLEPVETCAYVSQPLNFTEAYHIEHVHHWPGLDNSIGKAFNARVSGLFIAPTEGEYKFHVWSTNAVTVAIDREDLLDMGYAGSSIQDSIVAVNLTQGPHLFEIFRTQSDLFATLRVMWTTGERGWELLDGETLNLQARAPSFPAFGPVTSIRNVPINGTTDRAKPAFRGTTANEFRITPSLPNGLYFDVERGGIFGQMTEAFYGEFQMTASNPLGETTFPFTVLVGSQPVEGLVGRYYRVQDDRDVCTNGFDLTYADLYAVREQTSLQYAMQPRNGWWPHVPSAIFQQQAYVEWTGMLSLNISGLWKFRVRRLDVFELYIDGEMIGQPSSCQGYMNDKLLEKVLEEGYHPLRIVWAVNRNPFMLTIDLQGPMDEDYVPLEATNLKYFPSQPFYPSTFQNQLRVGEEMETITFRSFGLELNNPQYGVEPALPSGLTLTPDGTMIGTVTEAFEWTTFTVTALVGSQNYTTTVLLSAVTIPAPTEVTILSGETPISEQTLAIYEEMPELTVKSNEAYCAFTITPALPASLEYQNNYQRNSVIRGYPTMVSEKTIYTVTASTPGGSVTTTLALDIPACQYGKYLYSVGRGDRFDLYFYDAVTGEEVARSEGKKAFNYGFHTCMPLNRYTVKLRIHPEDQASGSLTFTLTREDGMEYFTASLIHDQWFNTTVELIPTTAPTLTFNATQEFLLPGEAFSIPYFTTGVFIPIYTTPEQPYLTINAEKKCLEGSFKHTGIYTYTIVCENDAGKATVPFSFYVGVCPEGMMMVHGSKPKQDREDAFNLLDAITGEMVVSRSLSADNPTKFMMCIDKRTYIATFTSTSASQSTPYYRPVTFTKEGELLGVFEFNNVTATSTRFRLLTTFGEEMTWRMWRSTKSVRKNWNQRGFEDRKWALYTVDQDVRFDDRIPTVYLRSTFIYDMEDAMAAMRVYVRVSGGMILYLNGNEALRLNLPMTGVTANTQAFFAEDLEEKGVWVWLNPALLVQGENVIAVETHVFETATPSNFRVFVSLQQEQLSGNQLLTSYNGEPSTTAEQSGSSGRPEAAFDDNDYSTWYSDSLPATLRLTFPNNERRYANRLLLRGTTDDSNLPVLFEIRGVVNDTVVENGYYEQREVSDVLAVVNNPYLFPAKFENYLFKFYPSRPYHAYEIRVLKTNKGWQRVDLNFVKFFAEKEVICPSEEGWTSTLGDTLAYSKCGFLQLGKSQRMCRSENFRPVWEEVDTSACLSRFAGRNEAFLDVSYRIYNCTIELFDDLVKEELRKVLVREMTVKEEDVFFYLPHHCSEETDYPSVCLNIRMRPHRLASEYVKMELDLFHENATGLFYKKAPASMPPHLEIQVRSEVVLRERMEGSEIAATITIVVLSILYIVQLYMYWNLKRTGELSGRKTLPKMSQEPKKKKTQLKIQERLI